MPFPLVLTVLLHFVWKFQLWNMLCTWHLIFQAFHCKYRKARNRHRWRRNRHIHASSHDGTVQGSDSTGLRRRASISSPSGSEYSIFGQRGFPVSFSLSHSHSLFWPYPWCRICAICKVLLSLNIFIVSLILSLSDMQAFAAPWSASAILLSVSSAHAVQGML